MSECNGMSNGISNVTGQNGMGVTPTDILAKAAQQDLEVLDQNFYMGNNADQKNNILNYLNLNKIQQQFPKENQKMTIEKMKK